MRNKVIVVLFQTTEVLTPRLVTSRDRHRHRERRLQMIHQKDPENGNVRVKKIAYATLPPAIDTLLVKNGIRGPALLVQRGAPVNGVS